MEEEIIHKTLDVLKQIINIEASFHFQSKGMLDGVLEFVFNEHKYEFIVEIKQELRTHQVEKIEKYAHQYPNFLLIADYILPKIKEQFKEKGIYYIETNGNIFLKKGGLFLFIDTKKTLPIKKEKGNRAFTKTGLKVIFYLLQHTEAINLPQRELANLTNVALGNIPQVIHGLKTTGYLMPLNKKNYVWENKKDLLNRWITTYSTLLRPKLVKERYTLKRNWQELDFDNQTVWGGEPAADILTNYLRPEKLVIYTTENRMNLIKNYQLIPNKSGEVEVLEMFWNNKNEKIAPALLVYADLILEGGKRNKETAEKIYHEYIESNL